MKSIAGLGNSQYIHILGAWDTAEGRAKWDVNQFLHHAANWDSTAKWLVAEQHTLVRINAKSILAGVTRPWANFNLISFQGHLSANE